MYAGLRLLECLRLRVQDIDFARNEIVVRSGKDRITMLPDCLKAPLQNHLKKVKAIHETHMPTVGAEASCPWPCTANIPALPPIGAGNGFFRSRTGGRTRTPASKGGIT